VTTSGASVFNLDLNNIFEEAFERCGKELRTGYEFRTARRSLNLLTIEWANRGINLWTIEQSMKLPGVDPTRIQMLKADYEEQWMMASSEDRETAPLRIVPRNLFYSG
jgi:hypothetical protein